MEFDLFLIAQKRTIARSMFICDEADVSRRGRAASSDDEEASEEQIDEEMMDFVNDATQITQLSTQSKLVDNIDFVDNSMSK